MFVLSMCKMLFVMILCISALSPASGYGIDSPIIDVSTSFSTSGSDCYVTISLLGRGVNDDLEDYCSEESAQAIIKEEYFIFGNPNKRDLCFYSEELNTLVVINGNECTVRTYETRGGVTRIKPKPMGADDCQKVKRFMVQKLEKASNPNNIPPPTAQISRPNTLTTSNSGSNYLSSNDNQPSYGKGYSKSPSYNENPNTRQPEETSGQGQGKGYSKSPSYNENPNTRQPEETSGQGQGKGYSKSPTYNENPTTRQPVQTTGKGQDKTMTSTPSYNGYSDEPQTGPIVRSEPVPNAAFQNAFSTSISTQTFMNSGSEVRIQVEGFGINEILEEKASGIFKPKILRSDSTLIIKDPSNDQMAVYTNMPSSLVIIRSGKCTKRRYSLDRTSTKISFESVSAQECDQIKQEMASTKTSQDGMFNIWHNFDKAVEAQERHIFERQQMFLNRGWGMTGL